ncbi:MAG: hypothetical protein IT514_15170 [Burkholderiales bacterium]|nr:hypothetical protein [Burkholderiales bacterium]
MSAWPGPQAQGESNTRFGELAGWQALLERHADLFEGMLPGSRIGILPRSATHLAPGRRLAGLAASAFDPLGGRLLALEAREDGMRAGYRPCRGFEDAQVDLLLVPDDAAVAAIAARMDCDALAVMKRMIREGRMLFFVMKGKHELQEAGYEDFLDSLGLAFLGACR